MRYEIPRRSDERDGAGPVRRIDPDSPEGRAILAELEGRPHHRPVEVKEAVVSKIPKRMPELPAPDGGRTLRVSDWTKQVCEVAAKLKKMGGGRLPSIEDIAEAVQGDAASVRAVLVSPVSPVKDFVTYIDGYVDADLTGVTFEVDPRKAKIRKRAAEARARKRAAKENTLAEALAHIESKKDAEDEAVPEAAKLGLSADEEKARRRRTYLVQMIADNDLVLARTLLDHMIAEEHQE